MPTHEERRRFMREYLSLPPAQQAAFRRALTAFIDDLRSGQFRPGLRVKPVRGMPGMFEMTWAPDGRAMWTYGRTRHEGEPHIIWVRIGTHDIFWQR